VSAGVRRMLTVGIDGASSRGALAAAEAFPQVYAAVGRHPNAARGFDGADLAELRALAAHERCVAIGETGLDFYREDAPPVDQQRAFAAQIALAKPASRW
jgi:TatD DNase family protein